MPSGEVVGTEQFSGVTPGDMARWLFAAATVATMGLGLAHLSERWVPPAGAAIPPAPPAILLELAPLPEPVAEPAPDIAEAPKPPELPKPIAEPAVQPEPAPEPEPAAEPPPSEPVAEPVSEPLPEPELIPEPEPVPAPQPEAPAMALPLPVTMSVALQQQRQDTPATNPQRPRQPRPEPAPQPKPQPSAQAAPQQQAAAAQPVAASGPSPQQWQQQVLRHIDRRKVYPRDAQRAGQEGTVAVAFTIDASGRVLSVRVARSSGFPTLDQAALDTARRASPVPTPPAALGNAISLTASIRFALR